MEGPKASMDSTDSVPLPRSVARGVLHLRALCAETIELSLVSDYIYNSLRSPRRAVMNVEVSYDVSRKSCSGTSSLLTRPSLCSLGYLKWRATQSSSSPHMLHGIYPGLCRPKGSRGGSSIKGGRWEGQRPWWNFDRAFQAFRLERRCPPQFAPHAKCTRYE